jgi:hypothetical protein
MPIMTSNSIEELTNRLFIARYSTLFNEHLARLDDSTKHLIRNSKQLNALYDLFLDFIIDSNQHLEYNDIKKQAKEVQDVGSN